MTVDGRDVVRITAPAVGMEMVVDADTYEPLEWQVRQDGRTISVRFETYERLPVDEATLRLLDIAANHPDATLQP